MTTNSLNRAREILAKFEKEIATKEAVNSFTQGMDILDEVIESNNDKELHIVASNVAKSYINKLVNYSLDRSKGNNIVEPELDHLNSLLMIAEDYDFGLKQQIKETRNVILRQLFEHIFRGHTSKERKEIINELIDMDI